MEHYIQYARKDNKIVHVSEVESGLACGCYCSHCNAQLVAKKGPIVVHHFAHYKSCECDYAYESALHAGVKRVLEEEQKFLFPAVVCKDLFGEKVVVYKSTKLPIEDVRLEEYLQGIIPDICINVGDAKCIIEIFVTHKVDAQKIKKVENLGIAAIEIDLSKVDREVNDDYIKSILLDNEYHKRWLFNPKQVKWEQKRKLEMQSVISQGNADEFKIVSSKYCADGIFGCPLGVEHRGVLWRSASKDCLTCKFFLKRETNSIICCARFEIWDRAQKKHMSYFGTKSNNNFIDTKKYLDQVGICPECGNLLIERRNETGFLKVCNGYPNCTYEQKSN